MFNASTVFSDFVQGVNNLFTNIGNRQYTEQNYVTNDEPLTDSIDALDVTTAAHLADYNAKIPWSNTPIISSDSNANGHWVRLPDGTQICYRTITLTPSAGGVIVDLPNNFTNEPSGGMTAAVNLTVTAMRQTFRDMTCGARTTRWEIRIQQSETYTVQELTIGLFAVGRWQ